MRDRGLKAILVLVLLCGTAGSASAVTTLFGYGYNVNGVYTPFAAPAVLPPSQFDDSGFDYTTGQGTITYENRPGAAGAYSFLAGFDIDIDFPAYTDEYVTVVGAPSSGQSWEADDPVFGDIFADLQAGTLDNTYPGSQALPSDISVALGWSYSLQANQHAVITVNISHDVPSTAFYLAHGDLVSAETLYYSNTLDIIPAGGPIPEPVTLIGLALGLGGIGGYLRKRFV